MLVYTARVYSDGRIVATATFRATNNDEAVRVATEKLGNRRASHTARYGATTTIGVKAS